MNICTATCTGDRSGTARARPDRPYCFAHDPDPHCATPPPASATSLATLTTRCQSYEWVMLQLISIKVRCYNRPQPAPSLPSGRSRRRAIKKLPPARPTSAFIRKSISRASATLGDLPTSRCCLRVDKRCTIQSDGRASL